MAWNSNNISEKHPSTLTKEHLWNSIQQCQWDTILTRKSWSFLCALKKFTSWSSCKKKKRKEEALHKRRIARKEHCKKKALLERSIAGKRHCKKGALQERSIARKKNCKKDPLQERSLALPGTTMYRSKNPPDDMHPYQRKRLCGEKSFYNGMSLNFILWDEFDFQADWF